MGGISFVLDKCEGRKMARGCRLEGRQKITTSMADCLLSSLLCELR